MTQVPDTKVIESEALLLVSRTNNLAIVTHDDYMAAGEQLKAIKGAQKNVIDLFKTPKDAAFKAHRAISEAEKKVLDPLKRAETVCAGKVQKYLVDEQKRKEEAARIARAEAERKAMEEAEAMRKKEEEEKINLAVQLDSHGFKEEAEQVLAAEAPLPVVTPVIAVVKEAENPRVEGVHTRTTYRAEVSDMMLLLKAIVEGKAALSLVQANEGVLNKMAIALRHELRIPGVKVIEQSSVVARAKFCD